MNNSEQRIIAVGDLHGKDCWKKINPDNYDRIIFMGDYVDSNSIAPKKILANLKDLIEFKSKHEDKVTLLLGNHDIQYCEYPNYRTMQFHKRMQPQYTHIFNQNIELFQVATQEGDYLFTHAGLSDSFARYYLADYYDRIIQNKIYPATLLNRIQRSFYREVLHTVSEHRGGCEAFGGITWADYQETSKDLLPGYHQVVGHTRMKKITKVEEKDCSITYIDVLDMRKEFLELMIEV